MKKDYISKLISALLIICMVIVTGSLSGCSGENVKDQLVGRWENNFESDEISNAFGGDSFTVKLKTELSFSGDGSFSDKVDEFTHSGTYTIDDNNKLTINRETSISSYEYSSDAQSGSEGKWYISGDKLYLGKTIYKKM